jgi:hypothetical protein
MAVPTHGEAFAKLIEYLRLAQEECATLAHLENANSKAQRALAWLAVSENMKRLQYTVTKLAVGKLQ